MASSSTKVLKLKSSDGKIFDVEKDAAVLSETIKGLVVKKDDPGVIPIPYVNAETLERVIDWCKKTVQYRGQEETNTAKATTIPTVSGYNPRTPWKVEFFKIDLSAIRDLLIAANYLEVKDLFDETCETVAGYISQKSPEEVRRIFDIENDLTNEEEIKAREWTTIKAREWSTKNDQSWNWD